MFFSCINTCLMPSPLKDIWMSVKMSSDGPLACTCINPKCANCNKSHLLFSSAEMFKKSLWQNSVDQDQIGAVCSGSTLFASILYSSVMLGNYLQQTTSADDIFQMHFFLAL